MREAFEIINIMSEQEGDVVGKHCRENVGIVDLPTTDDDLLNQIKKLFRYLAQIIHEQREDERKLYRTV